jgi:hypothetical protein
LSWPCAFGHRQIKEQETECPQTDEIHAANTNQALMSRSHRYQESGMNSQPNTIKTKRYARHVAVGKRIYLDVDRDVICGRKFDFTSTFCRKAFPSSGA